MLESTITAIDAREEICVCIATFRRPAMLARLLRGLAEQETGGHFRISAVVVDNDPQASAQHIVEELRPQLQLEVRYAVEQERNIAAVRNHALRIASGTYIAIIDDDEFPSAEWLLRLFLAVETFKVDGALGPVHPFFEQPPPNWLERGGFCDRPVLRTGTILRWHQTRTGNVLAKRDVFERGGIYFDERFRTGGSDQDFFKRAIVAGRRFVACAEAPVYEVVPPERQTWHYYVRRALVNGHNARKYAANERGLMRLFTPLRLFGATAAYAFALPVFLCGGKHRVVQCLERGAHHLSHLLAFLGLEVYRRRNF